MDFFLDIKKLSLSLLRVKEITHGPGRFPDKDKDNESLHYYLGPRNCENG